MFQVKCPKCGRVLNTTDGKVKCPCNLQPPKPKPTHVPTDDEITKAINSR